MAAHVATLAAGVREGVPTAVWASRSSLLTVRLAVLPAASLASLTHGWVSARP